VPADIAGVISRLSKETGVEPRMPAWGSLNGDSARTLLDALLQIKHALGIA